MYAVYLKALSEESYDEIVRALFMNIGFLSAIYSKYLQQGKFVFNKYSDIPVPMSRRNIHDIVLEIT
jgi:hypothetical protein